MKLKNTYYLLRHGQTNCHVTIPDFIYPKWLAVGSEIRLTNRGKSQIKESVKKLKNKKIDYIYSSDFFRTRQSSKIASNLLKLKVVFDKRLRDINLGTYHGKKKEEFYRDFPLNDVKKRFSKKPKNGESWIELKKRVKNFLKDTEKKYESKNILIISHGDTLWIMNGMIKNKTDKEMIKEITNKEYIKVGELKKAN